MSTARLRSRLRLTRRRLKRGGAKVTLQHISTSMVIILNALQILELLRAGLDA